jgi:hypothetical protein
VVKSVQYGVRHNSARSVDTMPLALELHGEIQGRIGKAGPQRRVPPAEDGPKGPKKACIIPQNRTGSGR